ncbi:MAG: GlcNAc-P-P-Und epimerase [Nocardioidaceae bacterium]|nr:GlcNAc-P-P-Und epimerase [Nocardioidaceae bacterium]
MVLGGLGGRRAGRAGWGLVTRRVLVTGSSGFIGTNVLDHCLAQDDVAVLGVDLRPPRREPHREHWVQADVTRPHALLGLMKDFAPTALVHLAGEVDQGGRSMGDYAVNVDGVVAALDAAERYGGLHRAVWASSRLVCDLGVQPVCDYDYAPPNFYARSKVIAEQVVRSRGGVPSVIVRPTSIWGPWGEEPYKAFFVALARGTYVHPRGDRTLKHYGYVGNTAHQLLRLLEAPGDQVVGRTLYLADPAPIEVGAFAAMIRRRMGLPPPRTVPPVLLRGVALAGDLLSRTGRRAPLTSDRLAHLRTPMLFDLEPLARVTGAPRYTVEEGIDATIRHLREQGDIRP